MESYVEITFMHNLLISAFSLTSSLVLSRKPMNRSHFWKILLMVTILPSFLFCENSMTWIWLNEIIMFLFLFKERNHTYLLFVTFRLLFHLIYYMLFEGVIYHLQFFVSDIFMVFLADKWHLQVCSWNIDTFLISDHTCIDNLADNIFSGNILYF